MRAVGDWCRRNRHQPVAVQWDRAAAQAAGPLRLLRHHRQLPCAGAVPLVGPRHVVQVAVSPLAARADDLGPLPASVPSLSPAPTASRAERLSCSYTVARGAGCANCARPDLWEPGAGDRPRPPGPARAFAAGLERDGTTPPDRSGAPARARPRRLAPAPTSRGLRALQPHFVPFLRRRLLGPSPTVRSRERRGFARTP